MEGGGWREEDGERKMEERGERRMEGGRKEEEWERSSKDAEEVSLTIQDPPF